MSISALEVKFDADSMWVVLTDGRTIGVPLVWFPRLFNGSEQDRAQCEVGTFGLHWEALDEDISIEALLAGKRDQTKPGCHAA